MKDSLYPLQGAGLFEKWREYMGITFYEISRQTLFRGFSEDYLSLLDLYFEEHHYETNTLVVEAEKLQDRFFILIAGEVEVYKGTFENKIVLDTLSAGSFFGEINLFDPGLATANVVSLTPVCTLEISNTQFRDFIKQRPDLAADFTLQLTETIVRRFRQTSTAFEAELHKAANQNQGDLPDLNRVRS